MAAALPISAWQPPSAPATVALRVIRYPTAAAHPSARTSSSSVNPFVACSDSSTPGITPAEPAVGAATMRPMDAFVSSTAMAYAAADDMGSPHTLRACRRSFAMRCASPPKSPPMEFAGSSSGPNAASFMMRSTRKRYACVPSANPRLS